MFEPLLTNKTLAAGLVRALYDGFDAETLEEILAVGRTYDEGREEVRCMNEALAALISEKRKADR